ncbi:MAG: sensor histidine kinase [Clostridiales bacterium]|nr:sensor histidine kinase [Candidatus Crickella caballi]
MLIKYLKSRAGTALLIILIVAAFTSSMLLFEMPPVTVMYPLVLSLVIVVVAGAIDYCRFCCRHRLLESETLPETNDLIEKDYQTIIEKLKEEEKVSSSQAASDYENMVEYYTVWVHQIKTPIASMRLNLQSEDTEFARKLSGDLNRIEAYVEMVLTFIRLDSNSTDYVIKEYNLDDIIKPAVRKFSREFILKKLTLDYKPTEYRVLTDEKWLSFIIEQVISNAVKYTSEGGVRIYMKETGVLYIEDTGIGIAPEDLPRIFENGYTGFNGREDKRASGIGLYLCRRIADNLGHGISAQSVPGEGTTIILDLRTKAVDVE